MSHAISEILQFVEENDVKFIRLAFCDGSGVPKNIAIMASELPDAMERGVSFDASAIAGFAGAEKSDLFLFPDPDTLAIFPWRPSQGCVARFYCSIRYPDGTPFEGDGRRILQQTVEKAAQDGYRFLFGPECEFYLFRTNEEGDPTLLPHDKAGYFDIAPLDHGENVRREICLTLEEMGIRPERSHHEQGPGQNEIDFRCASPLQAADNLMTLRTTVKAVAAQNGLFASFLPKPLADKSGSGLHINLSLFRGEENLFRDFARNPHPTAASFLAGILSHIREIGVFANPLPGSYRRFGSYEAPLAVSWSCENRSQLIRVPAAHGSDCRMEVRSPDPACNPSLTVALLLEAGMEGVCQGLPLPAPADFDFYNADDCRKASLPLLPQSLGEAVDAARKSEFLHRILPEKLLESYLGLKEKEWEAVQNSDDPVQYESQHYFEMI